MADELDVLLARVDDSALRADLRARIDRLRAKRSFGLVFESHLPERVRLPEHPIRPGAQVALRDDADSATYEVEGVRKALVTVRMVRHADGSWLTADERAVAAIEEVDVRAIEVIADFGEPLFPGLRRLGSIERGGDRPSHVVIKGENHHVLEALQFTHAGKVDCIYIDPPYNSGARDWKYNNDYVDDNDAYRHSKWLAFIERRLRLAKTLLNPDGAVLIVTIDEHEHERLGLLLRQTFVSGRVQKVSITTNPKGAARASEFTRVDEYAYFVMLGSAGVPALVGRGTPTEVRWRYLRRTDIESARGAPKGGPRQFYPIYVDSNTGTIARLGEPLAPSDPLTSVPDYPGLVPVFPIAENGQHMNWGLSAPSLQNAIDGGYVRVSPGNVQQPYTIAYLTSPNIRKVERGELVVTGVRPDGSKVILMPGGKASRPTTVWRESSHEAGAYGTSLLKSLIPGRRFPFPKSLYAVEDSLRYFVFDKPHAVVLDFFAGSGTTAHAVMRLNRQDGGRRQSIMVTNNEVSPVEAGALRAKGLRPGDLEWEALGIFEHITRPRVTAALTGETPEGEPIEGEYKFTDDFPMLEGFEENAEFMELTYLDADDVELDLAFAAVAPLLWLRAGAQGPVIGAQMEADGNPKPFEWTGRYGVLFDPDRWRGFVAAMPDRASTAFVVTDSSSTFSGIAAELPDRMDVVRLYENYLTTFRIGEG